MKLSVLMNLYADKPFAEVCELLAKQGVQAVEIGCGGSPGKDHADPEILLNDEAAFETWMNTFKKHGIELAALSCHGNPVHPDAEIAKKFDDDFRNAIRDGIAKMNIFTDLCLAGSKAIKDAAEKDLFYLEARNLKVKYIKEAAIEKMKLFGCVGKADLCK